MSRFYRFTKSFGTVQAGTVLVKIIPLNSSNVPVLNHNATIIYDFGGEIPTSVQATVYSPSHPNANYAVNISYVSANEAQVSVTQYKGGSDWKFISDTEVFLDWIATINSVDSVNIDDPV